MGILKIGGNVFRAQGKQGIWVPDEDGYYETYFGGLNVYNSKKEFYSAKRCMDLFSEASSLMRRIKKGCLYAENGHPKRLPGMTDEQYIARILQIYETNTCAHIKSIVLDFDFGKNNPQINSPTAIGLKGHFAPAGPFSMVIENALKNKAQNLAFSKRTLVEVERTRTGIIKHITVFVTPDYVLEGGIFFADKHFAPSVENYEQLQEFKKEYGYASIESFNEEVVDVEILQNLLSDSESQFGMEAAELGFKDELERAISRTKEITRKDRSIFLL